MITDIGREIERKREIDTKRERQREKERETTYRERTRPMITIIRK